MATDETNTTSTVPPAAPADPGAAGAPWRVERRLTDQDFARLSTFIQRSVGIKMPPEKRGMLELRLGRRLRSLGIPTFSAYCAFVFETEEGAAEVEAMVDAVTTNKTEFFRECEHFDRLFDRALPDILAARPAAGYERPLRVWSAGCSSGEEPYTLAMALSAYAEEDPRFDFVVHASDVSATMLRKAVAAVYHEERAEAVPEAYRRKYLLRSRDREAALVRVAPDVRSRVRFRKVNLLDEFPFREGFDIIFCRNVLIYFHRETQVATLRRMCDLLPERGYLFVGHSETLHGMDLPLTHVAPTVYKKVATA